MRRVLPLLLSLLFATPALAEAPVCSGNDLAAALKTSNPAQYSEIMKEAAAVPNGGAIFWKIEKAGVAPSWLLGTAHVTDARVTTLPSAADQVLDTASTVVLELSEIATPGLAEAKSFANAKLLVLPLGKSLWDEIPDDQEKLIRDNPNLPPGSADRIAGFQPWVVATMLSIPPCELQRKASGVKALDEVIGARAVAHSIPVAGLETVAEQLNALAGMPQDMQVTYLLAVARQAPKVPDYFETLVDLYTRREITAYEPFMKAIEPMSAAEAKILTYVDEDLVRQRNHRMAERAAQYLDKGGAFIAVGALHLPGHEGVVELLRQQGYKVTPIN